MGNWELSVFGSTHVVFYDTSIALIRSWFIRYVEDILWRCRDVRKLWYRTAKKKDFEPSRKITIGTKDTPQGFSVCVDLQLLYKWKPGTNRKSKDRYRCNPHHPLHTHQNRHPSPITPIQPITPITPITHSFQYLAIPTGGGTGGGLLSC